MKKIFVGVFAFAFYFTASAQSETGTASFSKSAESAVIYNMAHSDEAVSNGLENKMNKWGKAKKAKGYLMYRNVLISEISKEPVTLYFSVDKKSSKDNGNATLTMLIANEHDRFYKADEHQEMFGKAKEFLNGFKEPVEAADLELKITSQDESVKKNDKKLKKLRDDSIDNDKQKKKLEEKIAQNAKDIEQQEKDLATQKEQLDGLIKKRKN
ncbi:MAG: hypothetical protein H7Y86_07710 [Rhizobacter sp.]|nr:hypothetical protein [Ferruginibacter sp.]